MPGGQALGAVTREAGLAETVFQRFDGHSHEIAFFDFEFATVVTEFFDGYEAFGLEAGVDDDEIGFDADDFGGDDLAGAHLLTGQAFFEEGGKAFGFVPEGGCKGHVGVDFQVSGPAGRG